LSSPPALEADGRGGLTLGGARYLLIRPETLVGLQKAVVHGSPVAETYGPSTVPVCHLIRGVLESFTRAIFDRSSTVVETACAAMGAPVCRFVAS